MTDSPVSDYSKIFHAYDIRGEAGKDFNVPMVRNIARAYANYLCPEKLGRFVIGHDVRLSSPALAEATSIGIREAGHQVTEIGLSSTSLLYWYGVEGSFNGSVAITASHLPPAFNGLKLCREDALPLSSETGLIDILKIISNNSHPVNTTKNGSLNHVSPLPLYAAFLKQCLKPGKRLRIAVDAGNGMGGVETNAVFSRSGMVKIWPLGFHPDGNFPSRPSNPLEQGALEQLRSVVLNNGLSFGLAFDGDADRAVVLDEKGEVMSADALGGLIALRVLRDNPGATILYDLRMSRAFVEILQSAGARTARSRVGHAFIKHAMRENNAIFAAELSGHYYYADMHFTDNGLRTLIEIINVLSNEDKPLSELTKPFQRYPTSGEINVNIHDWGKLLTSLDQKYNDGSIEHLDGISVEYPDWWFNVRPSNTELLVRINIGAVNSNILEAKRQSLLSQIENY